MKEVMGPYEETKEYKERTRVHMCGRHAVTDVIKNFEDHYKIKTENIKVMRFYHPKTPWSRFAIGTNFERKDVKDPHVIGEQYEWVNPKDYKKCAQEKQYE